MASYFVACNAPAGSGMAVHDRTRCPPACFVLARTAEYLGEFLDAAQAVAVARLRYAHANGCPCTEPAAIASGPVPAVRPFAPS